MLMDINCSEVQTRVSTTNSNNELFQRHPTLSCPQANRVLVHQIRNYQILNCGIKFITSYISKKGN